MTRIRPSAEVRREDERRCAEVQRIAAFAGAVAFAWAAWSTVSAFLHHGVGLGMLWMLVLAPTVVGFAYVAAAVCSMSLVIPRAVPVRTPASSRER